MGKNIRVFPHAQLPKSICCMSKLCDVEMWLESIPQGRARGVQLKHFGPGRSGCVEKKNSKPAGRTRVSKAPPCWRGVGDPSPYVPGIPAEVGRFRSMKALFGEMACCTRCELARGRTQVVIGVGKPGADLMLVGEAPGQQEDKQGRPFVGNAGRMLDHLLGEAGVDRQNVFITNIVACRP